MLDKEIYSYTNTQANLISLLEPKMRGIDTDVNKNFSYVDGSDVFHVTANQKKYATGAWTWEDVEHLNIYGSTIRGMTTAGVKDVDTYIDMTVADNMIINVGGVVMADFNEASAQKYIWFNGAGGDVDFQVGDAPYDFFIEGSNGNVGIGTAAPLAKLHINAVDDTIALMITSPYAGVNNYTGLSFGYDNGAYQKGGIFFNRTESHNRGSLIFATDDTADASNVNTSDMRMIITRDGNVGIGVATPLAMLDIAGNHSSQPIAIFKQTNTGNGGAIVIDGPTDSDNRPTELFFKRAGTIKWVVGQEYNVAGFHFRTAASGSEIMTLLEGGNVGIGVAAPDNKLHVNGMIETSVNNGISINMYYNSGWKYTANGYGAVLYGTGSDFHSLSVFANNTGGAGAAGTEIRSIALQNSTGNVGINVTDPDTKLEILNAGNQLKLSFDGTDSCTFGVDTNGDMTITPSGTSLQLSNSDVAHGMTSIFPTTVYGAIGTTVSSGGSGGLFISGLIDETFYSGVNITGIHASSTTVAAVTINSGRPDSTTWQALVAGDLLLSIANYSTPVMKVYGNGDVILTGNIYNTPLTKWTPTLVSSGGTVPVYNVNTCYYSRIGNRVFFSMYLADDGGDEGSGSNPMSFTIPVNISSSTLVCGSGFYMNSTTADSLTAVYSGAGVIVLRKNSTGGYLCPDDQNNATRIICVSGSYEAA